MFWIISLVTDVEPPVSSGLTVQLRAEIVVTRPGLRGPGLTICACVLEPHPTLGRRSGSNR